MLSWVRCAGTLNVKITIKHLNLDSRLKKTGYSKSGKTVVSSNTGPYSCWKKLHCVYLLSLFNTMTIYHFLIRQTWSDLLPWIICCILAFSGEQHLQLKWGASDNNVYCKYDSSHYLFVFLQNEFCFLLLEQDVLMWCSILCWSLPGCPWCSSRVAAHIGSCACRGKYCMSFGIMNPTFASFFFF